METGNPFVMSRFARFGVGRTAPFAVSHFAPFAVSHFAPFVVSLSNHEWIRLPVHPSTSSGRTAGNEPFAVSLKVPFAVSFKAPFAVSLKVPFEVSFKAPFVVSLSNHERGTSAARHAVGSGRTGGNNHA